MIVQERCASRGTVSREDARAGTEFAAAPAAAVSVGSFALSTIRCEYVSLRGALVSILYVCLAIGVYRGNRLAAICLLLLFAVNVTISVGLAGGTLSWLTAVFAASFSFSILATFERHRIISKHDYL